MNTGKQLSDYEEVLLPKDIMEILHISRSTVYKLLDTGEIKSIRVGNAYRIPKRNLTAFMFTESKDLSSASESTRIDMKKGGIRMNGTTAFSLEVLFLNDLLNSKVIDEDIYNRAVQKIATIGNIKAPEKAEYRATA